MNFVSAPTLSTALLCLWPGVAGAAAPDKAVCAVEQAVACPAYEPCERTLPSAVNLPALMKIDRSKGVIFSKRENGETRSSDIGSETEADGVHVLQGFEDGHPWSMRIDLEAGRFTLVSAHDDLGFAAFGFCSSEMLDQGDGGQK